MMYPDGMEGAGENILGLDLLARGGTMTVIEIETVLVVRIVTTPILGNPTGLPTRLTGIGIGTTRHQGNTKVANLFVEFLLGTNVIKVPRHRLIGVGMI